MKNKIVDNLGVILFILFVIVITIVFWKPVKEATKDKDYLCELTYYHEEHNIGTVKVEEYYTYRDKMLMKIEKINGEVLYINLEEISVLCVERDFK